MQGVFKDYVKELNKEKEFKSRMKVEEIKIEKFTGINTPQLKQDIAIQQ